MKIREILKKMRNDKIFVQIACLIVSVALWVMVMIDINPILEDTYTNVPVTVRNLSALENSNMAFMNSDRDNLTVNIKVSGYGTQLNNIKKSDFSAYIDVLGFSEGTTNANVVILGPNGVKIESYYPSQITCKIDSVISKVMDVKVNYEGNVANNFYRGDGEVNPTSVKITGPRSIVDSAKSAVATVNVEGASSDLVKTVPVRIYDGLDNEIFMTVPTDNVLVSVPVYPTKFVNIIPKITGVPSDGYNVTNVTVSPNKIKIAAPQDVLNKISELELEVLDVTGVNKNVVLTKHILNTDGLFIIDLQSQPVVTAFVEKTIEKDLIYNFSEINFTNLKTGLEIINNIDNKTIITAKIIGSESVINKFTKDDLIINADLSNATSGVNQVVLKSESKKEVDKIYLNINTIAVEIKNLINEEQTDIQ
ncbi:MAG: hypothetical protein K0Q97_1473 [Bacillota bacterium]|nr:hypothetical protein [Bacillota bacterium]